MNAVGGKEMGREMMDDGLGRFWGGSVEEKE
jgi:hypothetical protein